VRWVELSLVMGLDRLDASAGDDVMIIVTMGNVGDTRAVEQRLDILVDGKIIATEDLPKLDSGGSYRTQFQWKAAKGAHTVTAVVGDQSWNEPVSVASGSTAAAGAVTNDMMWLVLILAIAVILAIWGRYALGKK
jgi:subtilase family serine protease